MNPYQTRNIHTLDATLIAQWKELWERAQYPTIFNSYGWFQTWLDTYKPTSYEILACYKDDTLVAIVPLYTHSLFGIKTTDSVNNTFLTDTPFLVETYDADLLKALFSNILVKRNLHLNKIDSSYIKLLNTIFPRMFFSLTSANPVIHYNNDPFAQTSKSTLENVKKIIRKNHGKLTFKMYDEHDDLNEKFEMMLKIDQNSSKKLRKMDRFSNNHNKAFFMNIIKNCRPLVRTSFLYYEGQPIAYQFGYLYGRVFLSYETSYLYEYRTLSPGKVLKFFLIEHMKNSPIERLDFGGGLSLHKRIFTQDFRLYYDAYYSPNPFVLTWWKSINSVRRLKQTFFPKKFTRDHEFLFRTLDSASKNT